MCLRACLPVVVVGEVDAADGLVAQLVREGAGAGYRVTAGPVWLMAVPAGAALPGHGWKLHISARTADFADLVRIVLPPLTRAGCAFKLARSSRVLAGLNDGLSSPASVGKAVTVYPDPGRVVSLARELAELLDGRTGPRILSDRRVSPSAPVYYRYGSFIPRWEPDAVGRLVTRLHGPGGEVFEGAATLGYRQPPWVSDPFTGKDDQDDPTQTAVLGGHYRIAAGVRRAPRGNIYRAVDERDGQAVIVKQARALVAEDAGGADTRLRLRNERRVLQALRGVAGVPRFIDHFRHAEDEFLVTSDCGLISLAGEVSRRGPYQLGAGTRSLGGLAAGLATILASVHGRGVIMRDLCPGNVVIGDAGPSLVDFGIASFDGLHLPGATAGFAPARQWRGEAPVAADDYYALGMTLLYAATGLEPVTIGHEPGQPRSAALATIGTLFAERPAGIMAVIADLLSEDESAVRTAFGCLLAGRHGNGRRPAGPLPAITAVTTELAAGIAGTLAEDLLRGTAEVLASPPGQPAAHDASIYRGSAGIGLELLRHLDVPGAATAVADLAAFSMAAARRVSLPPGLFTGTTGVSIFLRQAAIAGITVPAWPWELPGPGWQPEGADLMAGPAGVGLGHLWLHQATADPAHLAVAARCGEHIMSATTVGQAPLAGSQALTGTGAAAGRAHGLAGVTGFLLTLAACTGDQLVLTAATAHASHLADRTRELLAQVGSGPAPLALSWCQGLAGIGQVLLQASDAISDPALDSLARQAADVCIGHMSRLNVPARCCGAAGIGHLLIDLALARHDDRYWHAAHDIARHMLLRAGGSSGHPVFVEDTPDHHAVTWAFGIAGLLPFFRRLARPGDLDSLPLLSPQGNAQQGTN